MKKGLVYCIICFLVVFQVKGQDTLSVANNNDIQLRDSTENVIQIDESMIMMNDSSYVIQRDSALFNIGDSISLAEMEVTVDTKFKPNPTRAVIYSAIFPGLGQIYNRKYWKLPIIYGGFLGLTYAISWNNRYYSDYSRAYRGIMADDPIANYDSWSDMAPASINKDNVTDSQITWLRASFKRKKDTYRRYRDLSIFGVIAVYALCMIDAYVDAHLFDFDISPDLSMRVEPMVINPGVASSRSVGVQWSINF